MNHRVAGLAAAIAAAGLLAALRGGAAEVLPPVTAVAVSPDGAEVVVGSQSGVEVRSWPDLRPRGQLPTRLAHVHDLAYAPDGRTLAAVGGAPAESGMVELYRWPERELQHRSEPHRDLVYAVDWDGRAALLAVASADQRASVLEAATGKVVRRLEGHSRGVLAIAWLPDVAGLVTGGIDESLRVWLVYGERPARTLANHTRPVHDVVLRPGGDTPPLVASVSADRTVRFWQPTVGRLVRFARLDTIPLAAAWTADGASLAVACRDGRVYWIDPATVGIVEAMDVLDGAAYCLALAPDGSFAVGGERGQVRRVVSSRASRPASPDPPSGGR